MIGFYIARLRDFYCADRTRIFSLFVVLKEEKKICPLALTLFLLLKTTQQNLRGKREEMKMRKNSSKKIFIKNVAARALRKMSVLSFRAHHGRDIFVMNR